MSELVRCPWCEGTGHRALGEAHAETLALLRRQPTEINGTALAALAGLDVAEVNNRLYALEQMGFARGRWSGRERLWKANREAECA